MRQHKFFAAGLYTSFRSVRFRITLLRCSTQQNAAVNAGHVASLTGTTAALTALSDDESCSTSDARTEMVRVADASCRAPGCLVRASDPVPSARRTWASAPRTQASGLRT